MSDDLRLFDEVVRQALGGGTFDAHMQKVRDAVRLCDLERVRALDAMLALAVQLGTHAVVAKWTKRSCP